MHPTQISWTYLGALALVVRNCVDGNTKVYAALNKNLMLNLAPDTLNCKDRHNKMYHSGSCNTETILKFVTGMTSYIHIEFRTKLVLIWNVPQTNTYNARKCTN